MRKAIALFVAFVFGWPAAMVFSQEVATEKTRAVASAALLTLRDLARQQKNYRELGFESLDEMGKIAIGEPYQVFMVRLDELNAYTEGQDPNGLLHERKQFLYPVVIGDQVRSSITLASTPKGWEAASFGSPNRMKLLSKARALSIETTKLAPAAYFVVEVPGLKLVFVGYRAGGVLMLTPVLDDAAFKFQAGVAMAADKVFATIRVAAKSHMDLPG